MSPESLLTPVLLLAAAIALAMVVLVVRLWPRSGATRALGAGDFETALQSADTGPEASADELLAAATAAKHLRRFDQARALLERALALEPEHGEAWIELGLTAAYAGDPRQADEALARAATLRADLLESITLHRAWLALAGGRPQPGRFEEIEAPLENKLRADLGGGEPIFAEWFLQAADLWAAAGRHDQAEWARAEGRAAAPESLLVREWRAPVHPATATAPPNR